MPTRNPTSSPTLDRPPLGDRVERVVVNSLIGGIVLAVLFLLSSAALEARAAWSSEPEIVGPIPPTVADPNAPAIVFATPDHAADESPVNPCVDVWIRFDREGADDVFVRWASVEGFQPATYRNQARNGSTSVRCFRGHGVFVFRPMSELLDELFAAVRDAQANASGLVVVTIDGGVSPVPASEGYVP